MPKEGFALKPSAKVIQCLGSTCDTDINVEACCDAGQPCSGNTCLPGYMPRAEEGVLCANGVSNQCADCEVGTISAEDYKRTACSYCEDCPQGKHSNPDMDHCLDTNPIFACNGCARARERPLRMDVSSI